MIAVHPRVKRGVSANSRLGFYRDPSLRSGIHRRKLFFYPTESFYALGADATNEKAIRELFRVKHREKNKPIALIAADLAQVKKFFVLSKAEERLAKKFWPGPLTILLTPKKIIAADALFGTTPTSPSRFVRTGHPSSGRKGRYRIGVRVPNHAGARALAKQVGAPITATSANRSGQSPTKSFNKVKREFPGILGVPGRCGRLRKPSTVIEIVNRNVIILRPGAIHAQSLHP